jgi:diguanylate cyclase (GGDEF)-like protein
MGGQIGLVSGPGEGSDFWFTLRAEAESAAAAPGHDTLVAGLRVLCVEDKAPTRRFLEQHLRSWGIYYRIVETGRDALDSLRAAAAERRAFDLVLVDASIKGVREPKLAAQLIADDSIAARVIVLASQSEQEYDGAAGLIRKPLRVRALYECIAEAMGAKSAAAHQTLLTAAPPEPTARAARVLIVEDNRANQAVAVGMLDRLGCVADCVPGGVEALERLEEHSYDLVLMDCQMPGMDGYEATRCIRRKGGRFSTLPIIAMTANVGEGERETCLAAGMNEYLPKPLKLLALRDMLGQWIEVGTPSEGARVERRTAQTGRPVVDAEVFAELRESVGPALRSVIDAYLEDTPQTLEDLRKAIRAGAAEQVAGYAHALKGAGRNIGALRLAELARELEERARGELLAAAERYAEALASEHSLVADFLRRHTEPATLPAAGNEHATVLIADDDRAMRTALRGVLERDGYTILEATNGADALRMAGEREPDLLIVDALMPVMDGFELCVQMHASAPDVPLLMVTALDQEEEVARALASGASDYITKPVHFAVLRQRVRRLIAVRRSQRQVEHLAFNDTLTQLPNRVRFIQQLETLIAEAGGSEGFTVGLLDLDRFKTINEALGHDVGDVLIGRAGERIKSLIRPIDLLARMGGDEFAFVLRGDHSREAASGRVREMLDSIATPFHFADRKLYLSASIGLAVYPEDGNDAGTLLRHADAAMYRAKERGGRYRYYDFEMESKVARRMGLTNALRNAIDRDEFVVHYQPIFDLKQRRVIGAEALVRWQSPEHGLVPPVEFIEVCEEAGLIGEVGHKVMEQGFRDLSGWLESGYALTLSVNLSARQLEDEALIERVRELISATAIDPQALKFEITESVLVENIDACVAVCTDLKRLGAQVFVDDFGTGYSSLGYLKRLPVDGLKIDRTFVRDILLDRDDEALVRAILALAQNLGLDVVAEGVETEPQAKRLQDAGCETIQGYWIGRPVAADTFAREVLQSARGPARRGGIVTPLRRRESSKDD